MRRLTTAVALALPVLATWTVARPAAAYVRTSTDRGAAVVWPRSCVTVTARTADPPANLTPELVMKASRAAAAAWTRSEPGMSSGVACTNFELTINQSNTADAPTANDGTNNLVFRKTRWDYDPQALAITTVFAIQADGTILDADVEVNAVPSHKMFRWGDLIDGIGVMGVTEDLHNTLTHEFGHLLGLDHNCWLPGNKRAQDHLGRDIPNCDSSSAEIQEATMFASVATGDTLRRSLSPDDIAGVCAIYPSTPSRCETIRPSNEGNDVRGPFGCSVAQAAGPGVGALVGLAVGLLAAVSVRRRARRRG